MQKTNSTWGKPDRKLCSKTVPNTAWLLTESQDWFFGQSWGICLALYANQDTRPLLSHHHFAAHSRGWALTSGNPPGRPCQDSSTRSYTWSYPNPNIQVGGLKLAEYLLQLFWFVVVIGWVEGLATPKQLIWVLFKNYTFPKNKNFTLNIMSCTMFCLGFNPFVTKDQICWTACLTHLSLISEGKKD